MVDNIFIGSRLKKIKKDVDELYLSVVKGSVIDRLPVKCTHCGHITMTKSKLKTMMCSSCRKTIKNTSLEEEKERFDELNKNYEEGHGLDFVKKIV